MPSKIEWTDETWPVVTGCSPASTGCRNCYAARMAATRLKHHPRYKGLAVMRAPGMPRWTGEVRLNHDVLEQPLHWRKPRMIFVASMGDLFHERVPDEFIAEVFWIMRMAHNHVFQVLTKRSERMLRWLKSYWPARAEYLTACRQLILLGGDYDWTRRPLPNVWLGVSVENQAAADERREHLRQCSAAVKYVSYEPALAAIDWTGWEFVSQIISGGESGPGARPSHPDWHRATRDFCQEHGIAYFFKQWGGWMPYPVSMWSGAGAAPVNVRRVQSGGPFAADDQWMVRVGKKRAGRILDGRTWNEMPEEEK